MASDADPPALLVSPAVAALKEEANASLATRGNMERTVSQDIREERDDLKRAAEESVNAIMDLNLDGIVRWVSLSWEQLTGVTPDRIVGCSISDLITSENKSIFSDATESMRRDDSKSRIIRFNVDCIAKPRNAVEEGVNDSDTQPVTPLLAVGPADDVALEAQGIMVYDRTSGKESHTMWMVKPAIPREITIDLPQVLVESLGIGAHVLAQYLTTLADASITDPTAHPSPMPVLCRICERQITPWWFEKHTELCLQEHRAEMDIQLAHEALTEHRSAIVRVLDALEAQAKRLKGTTSDAAATSPSPQPEYKGLSIGSISQLTSTASSNQSSGRVSPASAPQSRGRDASVGFGHHRARSFAVRRPLARIVELVLDLCDTAMEIDTPAVKQIDANDGEIRTQSPSSDSRIAQVNQWQSPSAGTLETEEGLALLCDDTQNLCKTKVEAVLRCRRILEYTERIRIEFDILVQECIDAALAKAARIAAGELSDASEESLENNTEDLPQPAGRSVSRSIPHSENIDIPAPRRSIVPHSLAAALHESSDAPGNAQGRRASSTAASSGSNSPMGSRTPRSMIGSIVGSMVGSMNSTAFQQKRGSVVFESDAGAESDSSFRSSLASASRRAESPGTDLSLSRVASARGRKRTSLALPSLQNASRQESPIRGMAPPLSPLRSFKPRVQSGESSGSPITSPLQPTSEFTSPVIKAQHHHRRQSSVAMSDSYRAAPGSPRLSAISSLPQPKAVQASIKDFEIIKPISKGAFGSVYLAKKKITGDYYAIKVLKKGDMITKNQVTNVKAERAIMMWQGESDFVAKLYWTFSSKDYLYLVMEYLNGGDCASLIKTLGGLPEDWAKKYLAEVVLGVQHLHSRQIVHRDLKPDNFLIDQKGHLKLTDFGLSRMGLVGRQKRIQNSKMTEPPDLLKHNPFRRAPSLASSRSTSFDFGGQHSPSETPGLTPAASQDFSQPSYFHLNRDRSREPDRRTSSHRSNSGDSDALQAMFRRFSIADDALLPNPPAPKHTTIDEEIASDDAESPDTFSLQPTVSNTGYATGTPPQQSGMLPPPMALFDPEDSGRRFVGTPDYLAPETINGVGQDEMSDWWSLGCILFECLFGYPPFHASTPEEVFQNILDRKIHWPDDEEDVASADAKDLINKLLTLDPKERLGSNTDDKYASGGDEVRAHTWFHDIDWDSLREDEASFVPQPQHAEDTEYFDARGATAQNFNAEFEDQLQSPIGTPGADYPDRPHDALSRVRMKVNSIKRGLMPLHIPPHVRDSRTRRSSEPSATDDFGTFQFKNLPVLEKANKDVLSKLRAEAMQAQSRSSQGITSTSNTSPAKVSPSLEASPVIGAAFKRTLSISKSIRTASPSVLTQMTSSPNRQSQPSSPLLVSFSANQHERRKTSSGSSSLSQQAAASLQPGNFFDVPKLTKAQSVASSPVKTHKIPSNPLSMSREDLLLSPKAAVGGSPRQRSRTVGGPDEEVKRSPAPLMHTKRRSQVIDVSPSSSDTEDQRQKALLRVQRRRQSSRRLSQITLAEGPMFRPLDVLICEDHPVSRLVMERLLEKLRCRTIAVQNGSEAMRYAMSEVKFDIIMMEFKLPQINGADVARMIRETKNANTHTPIVAVTGYLKELSAPHDFDALIEKPPDTDKLSEVIGRLCMWKVPPPGWTPVQTTNLAASNLRKTSSATTEDSPTSTTASAVFSTSNRISSRDDSITSGSVPDSDGHFERIPVIISSDTSKQDEDLSDQGLDKQFGGLGISGESSSGEEKARTPRAVSQMPQLTEQQSAPAVLQSGPRRSRANSSQKPGDLERSDTGDAGDDEDDELGNTQIRAKSPKKRSQGSSKLGTEMLRTNSQGSVVSGDEMAVGRTGPAPTSNAASSYANRQKLTPPSEAREFVDERDSSIDATPRASTAMIDPDPTPRK